MREDEGCGYCAARRRNALVLAWTCVRGHFGGLWAWRGES